MLENDKYHDKLKVFGKRLKYFREKRNIIQLDLEIKSSINRTEISKIENGLKNIEFLIILKLADARQVELYELFVAER